MFCPKCGQQNPDAGKFCRSCGTDLGNASSAMTTGIPSASATVPLVPLVDRKGKPVNWESAITKLFMGAAFLAVTFFLVVSEKGKGWWFWLLIPAFMFIGSGLAQWITLKKAEKGLSLPTGQPAQVTSPQPSTLPPASTQWAGQAESRYKTGDLVPPSVTDSTTRHLQVDPEGQTMTLPKK